MTPASNKNRIILILFSTVILLLIIYLILDKVYTVEKPLKKTELEKEEINKRFLTILSGFAVKDEWIKTKDSINYIVQLPPDLPVTVILNDIYNSFEEDEAEISVEEKSIRGRTILEIISKDSELKADFRYNNKIFRKSANIGLLVDDLVNLGQNSILEILNIPEPFGVILVPSAASKKIVDSLNFYRKEYAIELNDELTEVDYRLSPTYSQNRLEISLREIISTFSRAAFFIVDDNSDFYSSNLYNFVKDELEKRNIKIILKDSLTGISDEEEFETHITSIDDKGSKLFLFNADDFLSLQEELVRFRKIGYRFINPSEIVFGKTSSSIP